MGSLALLAAIIILSFWLVAGLSVILSLAGFRFAGALFGGLSVLAGAWLLCMLPHVPFLGLLNLAAGGFSIFRYSRRDDG